MRIAACVVVLVLGYSAVFHAHEIGTTRVSAVLHDGRYGIEIVTDAAALAEKLEADSRESRVTRDDLFLQRVTVAFDGVAVRPDISYAVSPAADAVSPALATIRLTGETPAEARAFTWTYSWTFASYALSVTGADASAPAVEWLEGGQSSTPFPVRTPPPPEGGLRTAWRYLALGFTHIVPHGLDHMLFVIGIFLLSGRLRTVLWQVSAFTLAHSITLGLSIYGLIAVPPAIVEPLIAVSIAYVAVENIFQTDLTRWRIWLVFTFGLLHGMGFAGALQELGLPPSEFLTALLTFNLGVEAGQLAVIAAAFLLFGSGSHRAWYRARVVVPASIVIACTAVYWTVERLAF